MNKLNHKTGLGVIALLLLSSGSVRAQGIEFSAGPQVSTLGVGVSALARLTPKIGVSAEYNLFPLTNTDKTAFNSSILIEPSLQGGQFTLTFHPTGGKFALGAGVMAGGVGADALLTLDPNSTATIEIGTGEYVSRDIGNLKGTFEYGTVQPSFMMGLVGKGFNLVVGAAIATPTLTLEATGPLASDAAFQADLDREVADFEDAAGQVPVYPYLRLGWQFAF